MEVTIIKLLTQDVLYSNAVCHKCTCGEFLQDIREETHIYLAGKKQAHPIDLFWHLDGYCEKKYGASYWHQISINALMNSPSI